MELFEGLDLGHVEVAQGFNAELSPIDLEIVEHRGRDHLGKELPLIFEAGSGGDLDTVHEGSLAHRVVVELLSEGRLTGARMFFKVA